MKAKKPKETVQAITRYARMSPLKVRQVARTIQGMKAQEALESLRLVPRKSARLIASTLASAIANAENNHNISSANMIVYRVSVDKGPVFKRHRPAPRGSAHPYVKSTSHISIILK